MHPTNRCKIVCSKKPDKSVFKYENKQTNKQTKAKLFSLVLIFSVLFLGSCKKEIKPSLASTDVVSPSNRLSLTKMNFTKIYQELRKAPDKQKLILVSNLKNDHPNFISLAASNSDLLPSKTAMRVPHLTFGLKDLNQSGNAKGKLSVYGGTGGNPTDEPPTYDETVEHLISDNSFATLLNEEGEIEVDDIVYKVTPFGTFFSEVSNEQELNSVFASVYNQNDYTLRLTDPDGQILFEDITVAGTNYGDIKLLNQKIYFVDSFIEDNTQQAAEITYQPDATIYPALFPNPNYTPLGNQPAPPTNISPDRQQTNLLSPNLLSSYPTETNQSLAQNTADFDVPFRDGLGSLFDTFFKNATRYNYFNNNHYRTSALFYNRNYGLLKTLGVKVKFQKKGLFWWNKTDAAEIRAGWDYIAYKSAISVPRISLPAGQQIPNYGEPYLINPYLDPYFASPVWTTTNQIRNVLYGWNIRRGSNELFTIMIPAGLVPFKPDGINIKSSAFKGAIGAGWAALKEILMKSVPMSASNDKENFKFPIHSLNGDGSVQYYSINEIENSPKSFTIKSLTTLSDESIQTFISPYEKVVYNDNSIDIPLDFSTASITISTDPNNIALSAAQIAKSLLTKDLPKSFDVQTASIYGAVKYNNEWRAIRLKINM